MLSEWEIATLTARETSGWFGGVLSIRQAPSYLSDEHEDAFTLFSEPSCGRFLLVNMPNLSMQFVDVAPTIVKKLTNDRIATLF